MAKEKSIFVCNNCGGEHSAWQGKCQFCQEWNTLRELKTKNEKLKTRGRNAQPSEIVDLGKIESNDFGRITTGIGEFDRVLGGGIVSGSVILLGGDPGIGKSTLLLQVASNLAKENPKPQTLNSKQAQNSNIKTQSQNLKLKTYPLPLKTYNLHSVLYVSGEESANQVKMRLDRLPNKTSNLQFLAETDVDEILAQIINNQDTITKQIPNSNPSVDGQISNVVIIDSIQTMYDANFPSTPGSIVQVRECALKLQQFAKESNTTIILVGHVTKDGNVAGPRTLEHLVDVVLYLEGEQMHSHRILRGVKNRFGATDEIGIFQMESDGLKEVSNPSEIFLDQRIDSRAGSATTVTIEGSRPILLEVQALVSKTIFGYPKRTASGFDLNRLNLLIAVLNKRLRLNLDSYDVYINVAGGFRLKDPAVDLAVCSAIISAYKDKPIAAQLCLFGEVGLLGEIRKISYNKKREEEAKRLGFKTISEIKAIDQLAEKIFL